MNQSELQEAARRFNQSQNEPKQNQLQKTTRNQNELQ